MQTYSKGTSYDAQKNLEETANRSKELLQLHSRSITVSIHQLTAEGAGSQAELSLPGSGGQCQRAGSTEKAELNVNQLQPELLKQ